MSSSAATSAQLLSAADVPALSKPQRTRLQKKKQKKRKRMNGEELKAFYAHWCELWGQQKLLNFLAIQLMAGFVTLSLPLSSPSPLAFTCALHQAVQNCARPRAFAFKCAAPLSACFLSNPAPVSLLFPTPTPSPSLRTRCARCARQKRSSRRCQRRICCPDWVRVGWFIS